MIQMVMKSSIDPIKKFTALLVRFEFLNMSLVKYFVNPNTDRSAASRTSPIQNPNPHHHHGPTKENPVSTCHIALPLQSL